MKRYNKSFFSSFTFNWNKIVALLGRKSRQSLAKIIFNMVLVMGGRKTTSVTRGTYSLLTVLHRILKTQGVKGVVKYCKSLTVVLQQAIAGYHIRDLKTIGPRFKRTRSGLPRVIPILWRREIRKGNTFYMKLCLSISNIYRVMEYEGELKTSTITNPPSYNVQFMPLLFKWIPSFVNLTAGSFNPAKMKKDLVFFPIFSSGPTVVSGNKFSNFSSSNYSVIRALHSLCEQPKLLAAIQAFGVLYDLVPLWDKDYWLIGSLTEYLPSWSEFIDYDERQQTEELLVPLDDVHSLKPFDTFSLPKGSGAGVKNRLYITVRNQVKEVTGGKIVKDELGMRFYSLEVIKGFDSPLGKLGLKNEPAGKVRVFAMVDPITQWMLRPLHKALFSFIRKLPMDGTFNQIKPVWRLLGLNPKSLFSFDLSSATDRLPMFIQEKLVARILGEDLASHWKTLLVDRPYFLKNKPLYYATGQPMGALSSWAMLAWTHHFLVQCAAWRCGYSKGRLFSRYALLGDDIVIACPAVAKEYLHIMKQIDVPINLSKSIISKNGQGLEFAKRTFYKGVDVSPIPFREFSEATLNLTTFIQFTKKYNISVATIFKIMGLGFRVRGVSDLHASEMKGRYKWVKVMLTFPTSSDELQSWVSTSVTRVQLWALLEIEKDRLINWVGRKYMGWPSYVCNDGFKPIRWKPTWLTWEPRFFEWESWTVTSRVVRTEREMHSALNSLYEEFQGLTDELKMVRDPYPAFELVMRLQRLISLLSSSDKARSLDKSVPKPFRVKNRNNSLYIRWINFIHKPVKTNKR